MTKFYPVLTILFIVLNLSTALAQRGSPPGYSATFNNMMMQNQMRFMMNLSTNNFYRTLTNQKYKFLILMKDSTTKEVKSKIYMDTVVHKSYLTYEDKTIKDKKLREKRIYSDQTVSITRNNFNTPIVGMANDSCWYFKVISGRINAYSALSEIDQIDSFYLRAYQLNNGPVVKLDSAALAPIISKSPKALKAFKKKNFYKAINNYNSDKTVSN